MEDYEQYETLSLRARRKKPSVSFSCCFNGHHHHRPDSSYAASSSIMPSPSSRMSPSFLKGRYKNLISPMDRHRRHSSADFSYDPLSYSLNFEDSDHHHHHDPFDVDDFPLRSFASRLPLSPPGSGRPSFMTAAAAPPPYSSSSSSATRKTTISMQQRTPCTSRAAAVAEVRKSLEEANPREASIEPCKLEEMRSLDIPTPTPRKVKTTPTESRRNVDLLTPRLDLRHALVELC